MEIVIDIEAETPLFAQLIDQVKAAVQAGRLRPGDPLPSIRQLANDLDLNNKTVAKAYQLLERDSVIETKGYRGTFIHRDAKANCSVDVRAEIEAELTETIRRCRDLGATDSEIRIAFTNVMQNKSTKGN